MHKFSNNRFSINKLKNEFELIDYYVGYRILVPFSKLTYLNSDVRITLIELFRNWILPSSWSFGSYISLNPDYSDCHDFIFWQHPNITEKWASLLHEYVNLNFFDYNDKVLDLYIGMPWATFIDKKVIPIDFTRYFRTNLHGLSEFSVSLGLELRVHTVCQHVNWFFLNNYFSYIGITDLWLSHFSDVRHSGIRLNLHNWSIYAVNYEDYDRRVGYEVIDICQRKYTASFIGAFSDSYISDLRLKLNEIGKRDDIYLEITDRWHLESSVYEIQVKGEPANLSNEYRRTFLYNEILSNSKFSFCPPGAGSNTIRFWESLAMGVIPVLFDDFLKLPEIPLSLNLSWEDCVVFCDSKEISFLPQILSNYDNDKLSFMSTNCSLVYSVLFMKTCF